MKTAVVLATGPSMSQAVADSVRGRCIVVCVNETYQLAPWADGLVANDKAWWIAHPDAVQFGGRKFCGVRQPGVERLKQTIQCPGGTNSGMQAMRVAQDEFGATRILLCGFDMHGTHYFGTRAAPFRQTTDARREGFKRQFRRWKGCQVINCTPGSALTTFPLMDLDEALRTG